MKYFEVHKEELRGSLMSGQVYSDGEYSEEATELELRTITTGYSVYEYDENGVREDTEFFPVKTDMTNFEDDSEKVLETIKKIYSAPEWQNDLW